MVKRARQHSLESLLDRTHWVGACRIWKGYMNHGSPYVFSNGAMVNVRQLIADLTRQAYPEGCYWHATCGEPACVHPKHIGWRDAAEHMNHLRGKLRVSSSAELVRRSKISAAKRRLNDQQIEAIRSSDESVDVLMERFGISRSLVYRCRRLPASMHLSSNPWAALIG